MTETPQTVVNLVNYELGKLLSERTRLRNEKVGREKSIKRYDEAIAFNDAKIAELKKFLGQA